MTDRRDFKRRVRQRMAETGETYTAALRHVLAGRPEPDPAVAVVDMLDATEQAAQLGLRCRVTVHPELADIASAALAYLVRVLRGTVDDDRLATMRAVILRGEHATMRLDGGDLSTFMARVAAGLGGVSEGGTMLAAHVRDRMALFMLWMLPPGFIQRPATLLITTPDTMWWRSP